MKQRSLLTRGLPLSLLIAAVGLPLACIFAFVYTFYLQPDPVSPPATERGANATFDSQLAQLADQWDLLFREDNRIVLSDGYGQSPSFLLDLPRASQRSNSQLLGHESISPNGLRVAVNYYSRREASGEPVGEVIVVDIREGSTLNLNVSSPDYDHDWSRGAYWLTDGLLLVKTHRFTGDDMFSEQERYLLFDAHSASPQASFEFPPCPMFAVLNGTTESLLLASDCVAPDLREVWAIDAAGKRLATPAEASFLEQRSDDRYQPYFTYEHPSQAFPLIRIERVWEGAEGFGRFYERNWNRDLLYLGDKLVRVSDVFIQYSPDWQAGIPFFIWEEGGRTYIMDAEGHYRPLYDGVYIGRIPRRP